MPKKLNIGNEEVNPDRFKTFSELKQCLHALDIKNFQSLFFIDFSKSNVSYNNHQNEDIEKNPYYQILKSLNTVIDDFDDDKIFPVYRFGDIRTKDKAVLPLSWPEKDTSQWTDKDAEYNGFEAVIQAYKEAVTQVTFAGPTTLQPLIQKSIEYSQQNPRQHILSFILCDGGMCKPITDAEWVRQACDYPISFVIISLSQEYDASLKRIDDMKGRKFDNVNCVNYPSLQKTLSKRIRQELKNMGKHTNEAIGK